MQRLTHLATLLVGCAAAGAASFTLIEAQPARAVDYVKCEAMNKMYGRLMASMKKDIREHDDLWADKTVDPVQHQKWEDATTAAAMPHQKKINRVKADYEAAGCA